MNSESAILRGVVTLTLVTFGLECDPIAADPPITAHKVLISPGKELPVRRTDRRIDDPDNRGGNEWTTLSIAYNDQNISWSGAEIPIVLRERGGRLYLVAYDRDAEIRGNATSALYKYYRQREARFEEIDPKEYPKDLVTQNMFLVDDATRKAVLALDTASAHFRTSPNAFVWEHLMTGQVRIHGSVSKDLLDEYLSRYRPSKLVE